MDKADVLRDEIIVFILSSSAPPASDPCRLSELPAHFSSCSWAEGFSKLLRAALLERKKGEVNDRWGEHRNGKHSDRDVCFSPQNKLKFWL